MTMFKKEPVTKTGIVSGGQTQAQIDAKMSKMLEDFKPLFEGIGKAKKGTPRTSCQWKTCLCL